MLEVAGLDAGYGSLQVLVGVDLAVEAGESLALLGTNGAGKSTVLRAVSGLERPWSGSIRLDGVDVTRSSAEARVRAGLVQVPGGRGLFGGMTVAENLAAGAFTIIYERDALAERLDEVLALFPVLATRLRQRAGSLSGGEQQMLALAKALLLRPRVLLIDELSLGLAPVVVETLLGVIGTLRAEGVTLVVVEQSVNVALALADRAVFLDRGRVRFEGATAELAERDDIVRAVFFSRDPS